MSDDYAAVEADRSDQEYRLHPGFNQSTCNELLNRSPRHAFEKRRRQAQHAKSPEADPEHSREREMGTVIHKLILGSTVGMHEIPLPDYRTKIAKEKRAECEALGVTPILTCDLERCHMSANAAREQLREVHGIELDGTSELPLYWTERVRLPGGSIHELECKGKLDHVRADGLTILDIKSGEEANPKRLLRRVLDSGYHVQAAAYTRALVANFPETSGRTRFVHVFIETKGLTMCTPMAVVRSLYELGERQWLRGCQRWAESVHAAQYDGYVTEVWEPEAPPWAMSDEMAL
jgi:hypothetical protein